MRIKRIRFRCARILHVSECGTAWYARLDMAWHARLNFDATGRMLFRLMTARMPVQSTGRCLVSLNMKLSSDLVLVGLS